MFEGWQVFALFVGIGVTAVGSTCAVLLRHMNSDTRSMESIWRAIAQQQTEFARELTDFKLAATKEFVSIGHLLEVEARLVKHLDKIESLVDRALRIGEPTERRMDNVSGR